VTLAAFAGAASDLQHPPPSETRKISVTYTYTLRIG
jgi:hypothetical protein